MNATSERPGASRDPEQLERAAERLRADLDRTLDALERKLSPSQLLDRSLAYLRRPARPHHRVQPHEDGVVPAPRHPAQRPAATGRLVGVALSALRRHERTAGLRVVVGRRGAIDRADHARTGHAIPIGGRTTTTKRSCCDERRTRASSGLRGSRAQRAGRHADRARGAARRRPRLTTTNTPRRSPRRPMCVGHSLVGPSKLGRSLLAMRGESFGRVRTAEAVELVAERRVEGGTGGAIPVVERVLGPPDGGLRHPRELHGDLERSCVDLIVVDAQRDETDPLGFLAGERVAREEVVLRLGHAARAAASTPRRGRRRRHRGGYVRR